MKRKERKVAWAITEDYSKGIKGHYKLKTGHGKIENLEGNLFKMCTIILLISFLGILVTPQLKNMKNSGTYYYNTYTQPVKIDLNKKPSPKQKTFQTFKV